MLLTRRGLLCAMGSQYWISNPFRLQFQHVKAPVKRNAQMTLKRKLFFPTGGKRDPSQGAFSNDQVFCSCFALKGAFGLLGRGIEGSVEGKKGKSQSEETLSLKLDTTEGMKNGDRKLRCSGFRPASLKCPLEEMVSPQGTEPVVSDHSPES